MKPIIKILYLFFLLLFIQFCNCKRTETTIDNTTQQINAESKKEVEKTSQTKSVDYLSELENEVVAEMNKARTNPKEYAILLENTKQYYDGYMYKVPGEITIVTSEGVKAVEEAIDFLKSAKPLTEFRPSKGMSLASKDHVNDQGKNGSIGHTGSDGSTSSKRLNRYGKWKSKSGENISYGSNTAQKIVMQLIIDDGVPSRGHRLNIFDPKFNVVGVAFGTHSVYRYMCVITFADDYTENDE